MGFSMGCGCMGLRLVFFYVGLGMGLRLGFFRGVGG